MRMRAQAHPMAAAQPECMPELVQDRSARPMPQTQSTRLHFELRPGPLGSYSRLPPRHPRRLRLRDQSGAVHHALLHEARHQRALVRPRVRSALVQTSQGKLISIERDYEKGVSRWVDLDPAYSFGGTSDAGRTQRAEVERRGNRTATASGADQFALEMDHMASCFIDGTVPHGAVVPH
jgi:hypothetical protein